MENKLEPHKYIFKIFASILFDELRVTNFEVKRGVILNKKIPNGIKYPKSVEEFEKGVEEFFLFNPSILSQVYFLSAENEFKEFLNNRETIFYFSENNIEISFPEFSCATTEFYYYLITNEAIRTLVGIEYFVSKEEEEEKKISYLQTVLTLISIYITGGVKRIIDEREFLPQVPIWEVDDELAEIHSYTYKVLILALVRFYKEIIYAFRPLVDDLDKSVLELLHRRVDNINSNLLELEINFGILWLKVKDLFESENFNIEEALKLLTELYKQKENNIYQEKRILAITCLENQLFLFGSQYYEGCNDIIKLNSFSFCNPRLGVIQNDYKRKIESHNTGYDRYEEVENLMSQINQVFDGRIQNDSGIENSIPRELLKWLDEKKECYRNQINTSFKKKPEKGPRKKRGEDEIPSFHYKKYASNSTNLTDLKKSLENKGFIKKIDLHKRTFEKIFSGKEISEAVVWEESIEALKYFIILIHWEYCVIDNISPYHLAVACKCFKPKDMPSFTRKQLGKAHKPSEDIQILLEEMVQNHLL